MYWYFIIFFIPLIGCIIYLLTQVINKSDVTNITEEITTIINPTKKIKDLETALKFSNTFQNKINLADAYAQNKEYKKAIDTYEKALESNFKDDPYTLNKLITCYFNTQNFDKVIEYAQKIDLQKDFKETIFFYGLALEQKGALEKAEIQLRKIDIRYSHYNERLELSKFLIRHHKKDAAKEVLTEVIAEITAMTNVNARKHRSILSEASKILNEN
ncbi:tetratricopeptide repeat protein [Polaribacter sp. Z014]|uniref:tetratricopeptide repeat protein n=1 Tax=unclassified Polaribacter TaxID=196858 RepID=UPI00193B525F|nr:MULTISPECIES: tetratricopeptide repeat protein [unclassified Polaribacter]MCL7763642.1 tetratricopeptide repeat protein [Polaribacter sp. Z014]QVY65310.1 tetratricopeptide repeat protein [Polaribacter sp. Q13]